MDWYYGWGNNDFLVPKDQDLLLDRHPSLENWSKWRIISEPEGFNSPQNSLIMDTEEPEVEFNFIDESFNNEIEFDPSLQQTELSCDHQQPKYPVQDLSSFERMDDIFLDSVLEDFPCVENLDKSFFYPDNQCSNISGGSQKDIEVSEFDQCNSDSKDYRNIETILDSFEQSNGDEIMHQQLSHEESTLQDLEMIISQFTAKTRTCFRDALYRLARDTKQHVSEELNGGLNMHQAMPSSVYNETMRSEDQKPMESETNSVDRAVANLMFNKMEINILDLPFTTLVNLKQEVIGNKGDLQGKSSNALDAAQKSHYPHPQKVQADAEVPRFGLSDLQEATESHIAYADSIKKSSCLSLVR